MKIELPIPIVLFLVFLTLKLTEVTQVANWDWIWVTSPLWIPYVVFLSLIGLAFLINEFAQG